MSDNDCDVELIAAAQVAASSTGASFNSKSGFKSVVRDSAGVYTLSLKDKHDATEYVINVTQLNGQSGESAAAPIGTGRVSDIAVTLFDGTNTPVDQNFMITVYRVRS